ncbi:MAG TPA: S8 family serine peptidase [Vicinamibacterales bacterium]|nr:S8 family serine peptidase [Vicinamibacterales bacterium]
MSKLRALGSCLAAAIVVTTVQASSGPRVRPADGIGAGLQAAFAAQEEVTYLIVMKEQGVAAGAADSALDRDTRGWMVYRALKDAADRSQAPVLALLAGERAAGRVRQVRPFFSVNAIAVVARALPPAAIANHPAVDYIVPSSVITVPPLEQGTAAAQVNAIEWNIAKVRAPEVWASGFRGQGIVVAHIDTGARFDHPALVGKYRGNQGNGAFDHNYNWFDPPHGCGNPSLAPCDLNGHGTATMGTMLGDDGAGNQIGMAPDARWIACDALPSGSGTTVSLIACGDWMLAPTDLSGQNPDPARRPDVINNSWGNSGGDTFFQTILQNWRTAGIFPAFANGNNGPTCLSSGSPGDNPEAFSAGATDINDALASFSARGPSTLSFGIKPDVSAPGVNIRSSARTGGYGAFTGTSMASPHVAGLVALLWSKFPNLRGDVAGTESMIRPAALMINAGGCGIGPEDQPNNLYGWGRIDARRAVQAFPIHTDRSVYRPGHTLTVSVSLLNRLPAPQSVDLYVGVQGPSGPAVLISMFTTTMAANQKTLNVPLFNHTWTLIDPAGPYTFFSIMTARGVSPANPANWLSVDAAPVTKF